MKIYQKRTLKFHAVAEGRNLSDVFTIIKENTREKLKIPLQSVDIRENRTTCKLMLEEMGYSVILAKNGQSGIDKFQQYDDIALVIMEMIIPEMDDKEAFFKMKEIDKNVNVIVASGSSREHHLQDMRNKGLMVFLKKTNRDYEINQAITKALGNSNN